MTDSILLNISTNGLENVNTTHDFIFRTDKLNLDPDKKYSCALLSYSMWYSWYNITNSNNQFKFTSPSGTQTISIPNGNYGVSDLSSYIKTQIPINDSPTGIKFTGNYNTLRVDLELETGFSVDFTIANTFNSLFGLDPLLYNVVGITSGQSPANISNSVDALLINCSILDASKNITNNSSTTALHFITPKVGPGSNIAETIAFPLYLPVSVAGHINTIRFSITDQSGNLLDLNNENVSLSLSIREVR